MYVIRKKRIYLPRNEKLDLYIKKINTGFITFKKLNNSGIFYNLCCI